MASSQEETVRLQQATNVIVVEPLESNGRNTPKQQQAELTTNTTTPATVVNNCNKRPLEENQKQSFCAGCNGAIRDKFIFSVIDLYWHQDCVQCSDCSHKLTERCYTFEGKLYCKHDYWHRFGPKCFACKESIDQSELVQRIKGNRVYHLKCFTCFECRRQLEQGEQLHLIDDKRLLCKQDFQKINLHNHHHHHHHHHHPNHNHPGGGGGGGTGKSSKLEMGKNHNNNNNNHNGFSNDSDDRSASAVQNSYFTLLSSPPSAQNSNSKSGGPMGPHHKRSSLTSLDNMTLDDQDLVQDGLACAEGAQDEAGEHDEFDAESLDEFSTTTYKVENNNLENEENRLGGSLGCLHDNEDDDEQGLDLMLGGDTTQSGAGGGASTKPIKIGGPQQASANKKKRRRKQRHLIGPEAKQQQQQQGKQQTKDTGKPGAKMLSLANSRNGESILNGSASAVNAQQPAASILAGAQLGQGMLGTIGQQHGGDQQVSCSSSSSTSSNHSTSSNSTNSQHQHQSSSSNQRTGTNQQQQPNNHNHLDHQHHQHNHQSSQQHQHQTSGGAGGNGGGGGGGHKPTRVRTVLNEKQLQTLRDCYANNPRPDALLKEQLVDMTGLSPRVIRVWFQNKRCKDKKKSILYKQMQQHEKDGRHLAGLTHIRGVPMVAASPVQYQDEHSSAANTPLGNSNEPGSPQAQAQQQQAAPSVQSPQLIQQQQQQAASAAGNAGALDIHAYQPPWKGLAEYAQQQQQQQGQQAGTGQQVGDRLNASSPRYQQLIGQIHGYAPSEHQVVEMQQQQQQYGVAAGQPPARPPTSAGGGEPAGAYPPLMQPPPLMGAGHHPHQHHHNPQQAVALHPHSHSHPQHHPHHHHLTQLGAGPAPMAVDGHHLHQFQH